MKNSFLFIVLLLTFSVPSFSQSCLPDGITFYNQEEVDNFQSDYPGCTEIEGQLRILYDDINNLNGLSVLTSIGGNLRIQNTGFLVNLSGLDNLTSIGGDVYVSSNSNLVSLSGLSNLSSVGNRLFIGNNASLQTLDAFGNLTSIGGNLEIQRNNVLESIEELTNLTSLGGGISIAKNYDLTSLDGLENIPSDSINFLEIYGNTDLAICDYENICGFIADPKGPVTIYNNAPGCENLIDLTSNCGVTINCLPYGNYCFTKQSDVDDFQSYYPDCTDLEGSVIITGDGLTNLNGLTTITSVGNNLTIADCDSLTNLTGLDNVSFVGNDLKVLWNDIIEDLSGLNSLTKTGGKLQIGSNDSLTSLSGLANLDSIYGRYDIFSNQVLSSLSGIADLNFIGSHLLVDDNDALTDLSGLQNIDSINGVLFISNNALLSDLATLNNLTSINKQFIVTDNPILTSLSGLENIDANSFTDLIVYNNNLLTTCEIESVCDFINNQNGVVVIEDNAEGCNTKEEVKEACKIVSIEKNQQIDFKVYPNPSVDEIYIIFPGYSSYYVKLFNTVGELVMTAQSHSSKITLTLSGLPAGIYIIEIQNGEKKGRQIIVKQ